MVRNPLQSCESWISRYYEANDYSSVAMRISTLLHQMDVPLPQNTESIGLRLEDLKTEPGPTLKSLCRWMAIKETDSLYQTSVQGKLWVQANKNSRNERSSYTPFDTTSINYEAGRVFSECDQHVLQTLFYPFNVTFGYQEANHEKFLCDLKMIKPLINETFDFEKCIIERRGLNPGKLQTSGPYNFLRRTMQNCWHILNEHKTYPNMLKPLTKEN